MLQWTHIGKYDTIFWSVNTLLLLFALFMCRFLWSEVCHRTERSQALTALGIRSQPVLSLVSLSLLIDWSPFQCRQNFPFRFADIFAFRDYCEHFFQFVICIFVPKGSLICSWLKKGIKFLIVYRHLKEKGVSCYYIRDKLKQNPEKNLRIVNEK